MIRLPYSQYPGPGDVGEPDPVDESPRRQRFDPDREPDEFDAPASRIDSFTTYRFVDGKPVPIGTVRRRVYAEDFIA